MPSGPWDTQTIIIALSFYCENSFGFLVACDIGMSQPCFDQALVTIQTGAQCGKSRPTGQCKQKFSIMSLGMDSRSTSNRTIPKAAGKVYCDIIWLAACANNSRDWGETLGLLQKLSLAVSHRVSLTPITTCVINFLCLFKTSLKASAPKLVRCKDPYINRRTHYQSGHYLIEEECCHFVSYRLSPLFFH